MTDLQDPSVASRPDLQALPARTTSTASEAGLDQVILVDDLDLPIGVAARRSVHSGNTPLHRAFSLHLFNASGEVLLTRRALGKSTWPGVWTNACCGHPRPGERTEDAVRRRVSEELGTPLTDLRLVLADFRYQARDASGIIENEICPVYTAVLPNAAGVPVALSPDPDEVVEYRWASWDDVVASVQSTPWVFSPWSVLQVDQLDHAFTGRRSAPGAESQDADATLRAVDQRLREELAGLAHEWQHLVPLGAHGPLADCDLPELLERLVFAGGKRLRPALSYWGFVAAGGDTTRGDAMADLVSIAAALELLHAFALIHDDVMDGSEARRGLSATHVHVAEHHRMCDGLGDSDQFGLAVAILLGDLAHSEAERIVAGMPPRVRHLWQDLTLELIAGQRTDLIAAAAGHRLDLDTARRIAHLKSGAYTIQRPALLGAEAAQASPAAVRALTAYGRHAGLAFALRDDILGVWGDPDHTGKPAGDDLASGKATVLRALAGEEFDGPADRALRRLGTDTASAADVDLVRSAMESVGIRGRVEQMISDHVTAARDVLALARADGLLTPAGIDGLVEMAERVAWRHQ